MKQNNTIGGGNRHSGIDLLRIVAMLMVCVLHVNLSCRLYWTDFSNMRAEQWWYYITEAACIVAVNLYALVTGYVCVRSSWKISRYIRLWLQVVFYGVCGLLLHSLFIRLGYIDAAPATWMSWVRQVVLAPFGSCYWYFNAYTVLFLLIPFLNPMLQACSRESLRALLLLILLIIAPAVWIMGDCVFLSGYNATWLLVLYMAGAYAKLHPVLVRQRWLLAGWVLAAGTTVAISFLSGDFPDAYLFPPTVLGSMCLFLFFLRVDVRNRFALRCIALLAPFAFGVYLVHLSSGAWALLIQGFPKLYVSMGEPWWLLLVSPVVLYFTCTLVDMCRSGLFRLCRVDILEAAMTRLGNWGICWAGRLVGSKRRLGE